MSLSKKEIIKLQLFFFCPKRQALAKRAILHVISLRQQIAAPKPDSRIAQQQQKTTIEMRNQI
jgi:hypothetical protein